MYKSTRRVTGLLGDSPPLAKANHSMGQHALLRVTREQRDMERRACAFAMQKVDGALAVIAAAYTLHEGIYHAFLDGLLGLEEIDQLPLAAQSSLIGFLSELVPDFGPAGIDQVRAAVSLLSESEALQLVDNLLDVRLQLEQIYLSLGASMH